MHNKKIIAIIIIFVFTMILITSLSTVKAIGLGESFNAAQHFTDNGKSSIINYQGLYDVIKFFYNVAMIIAIVIAVIIGIILGIRIVWGSIDERADSKHLIVPYLVVVGFVAFGFTIWKIALGVIYKQI